MPETVAPALELPAPAWVQIPLAAAVDEVASAPIAAWVEAPVAVAVEIGLAAPLPDTID